MADSSIGINIHLVRPDGFEFFRSFLSRDGEDEFSAIILRVKTKRGENFGFTFYSDVDHKDPVTIKFGEDTLILPGRKQE